MIDDAFIKTILQKGAEAKEKVQSKLPDMSLQQMNWKPLPGSWSIAQCLDHLVVSHRVYFPALQKIIDGTHRASLWERISPFSRLFGRVMKNELQEEPKRKLHAPKVIYPSTSDIDGGIIERYKQSLDQFLQYIADCSNIDIDKIIITSPANRVVTYSLRDAFQFLIQHEHRHINQAIRVRQNRYFPGGVVDANDKSVNLAKYPYDKELIKKKILDIKADIEKLIQPVCREKFSIDWYGAYDIDPKHLVYWICVKSDKMKNKLAGNQELVMHLRALLEKHEYPAESQKFVHIGFESQETVDRKSKGNWYHHFK